MLSLFVPTFNRSAFVVRQLHWLDSCRFKGEILIGDGSTDYAEASVIASVADSLQGRLKISHHHLPGQTIAATAELLFDKVTTPYCALLGDDDYCIPETQEECALFLEHNPDYAGAHGQAFAVSIAKNSLGMPEIEMLEWYPQSILEHEKPTDRLLALLANYTVNIFSVMRTATWRRIFEGASSIPDKTFADELLACCSAAIEGKFTQIERLGLVRQSHPARILQAIEKDWIAEANWSDGYARFRQLLVPRLARAGSLDHLEAEDVVRTGISAYLKKTLDWIPSHLDLPTCSGETAAINGIQPDKTDNGIFLSIIQSLMKWPEGNNEIKYPDK